MTGDQRARSTTVSLSSSDPTDMLGVSPAAAQALEVRGRKSLRKVKLGISMEGWSRVTSVLTLNLHMHCTQAHAHRTHVHTTHTLGNENKRRSNTTALTSSVEGLEVKEPGWL